MEEIFCMEWNMEEIFRYGMEKIVGMEYGKIVFFHSIPLHALVTNIMMQNRINVNYRVVC